MENTLFSIKASCVRANPPQGWRDYDLREASDFIASRTIRLADVLLAMRKTDQSWYVRYDGVFFKWEKFTEGGSGHHGIESTYVEWNLREDDLEKQSPETIEFLANVLAV